MTNQTDQSDVQEQPQSNLPAVVGTLLDNLKAVISDQMPDEDAYILSIEMVGAIEEKFVQVMEDGRMMVQAALEQRDEAISLQQIAEQKADEIVEALDDWMDTDNELVRDAVQGIEETLSEYLYENWSEMVAGDDFVEQLATAFRVLAGGHFSPRYDLANTFLRISELESIPNPLPISQGEIDVMEAALSKLKELAAKADPNFYGVRPDEDEEAEGEAE